MSASQTTMDKLYGMRLSVMAQAYRDQEEMLGVADMTFDERFAMIVDAEWDSRRINKRTRLLRQAAFSDPENTIVPLTPPAGAGALRETRTLSVLPSTIPPLALVKIRLACPPPWQLTSLTAVMRELVANVRQSCVVPSTVLSSMV